MPNELWAKITTFWGPDFLTQPQDIAADLVEDGGTSKAKSITSGLLWPWIATYLKNPR